MGARPIGLSLAGVGHGVDARFHRTVLGWRVSGGRFNPGVRWGDGRDSASGGRGTSAPSPSG